MTTVFCLDKTVINSGSGTQNLTTVHIFDRLALLFYAKIIYFIIYNWNIVYVGIPYKLIVARRIQKNDPY
jgi:hypothetical protein